MLALLGAYGLTVYSVHRIHSEQPEWDGSCSHHCTSRPLFRGSLDGLGRAAFPKRKHGSIR